MAASVGLLLRFLEDHGAGTDAGEVTPTHLRAFIIHLRERRCFEGHPLNRSQERGLSGATVNTYLRAKGFQPFSHGGVVIRLNRMDACGFVD